MPTSAAVYCALLRVLPRSFRDEFGDEMSEVFQDQLRRTSGAARTGLWLTTIATVTGLAVRLRVDQVRLDLRHALRGLWRQKVFTTAAVLTLALALGPATAVFNLVRHVVLDPMPGAEVERVVYVWAENPARNLRQFPWSELNFLDYQARQRGLAALAAFTATSATFGGEVPQQLLGTWVAPEMFSVLGITPARGRGFDTADTLPGAAPVIILGHRLAASRFGDRDAVGQSLVVDGRQTTVIGVLPERLHFPGGASEFWQPMIIDRATSSRGSNYLSMVGRLETGVEIAAVEQQLNQVAEDLEREYPSTNSGYRAYLVPATRQLTESARPIISVLGFTSVAIFLLACTNIASLMVVRVAGRHSELAVRTALGASRARLSRQLLVEHLLLAGLAAVAAVGVSFAVLRLLMFTKLVPAHQVARSALDGPAFLFLTVLMAATAVSLGWIVSRHATRAALPPAGGRTQSASRDVVRLRQALVSIEVGAAVVLLVAATLLLQSAARVMAVDPGFRAGQVITFQVGLPMNKYMALDSRRRFVEGVVDRLAATPGVELAASAGYAPMSDMRATRRFAVDGQPLPAPGSEPLAIDLPADPNYAAIMGLRLLDGRWIEQRDRPNAAPVVVISESLARQHFPGERAVGQRLRFFGGRPNQPPPPMPEIIGVVSDVRQFAMAEPAIAQMYVPQAQRPWTFTAFFVRAAGDPRAVMGSLQAAVHAVDAERPVEALKMLSDLVSASTADRRALSGLLVLAAAIALLISAIGVYGVTAATTEARRRELAIRAAVGASRHSLLRLVIRQGMVAAGAGVILGLGAAAAAAAVLQSVLYEVRARDPWTLAGVGAALLAICWVATYLPARRAVTASPAEALRAE